MKKKIVLNQNDKVTEREVNFIPFRYIVAILLVLIETVAVIAIMTVLTIYIPYFYFAVIVTQLGVAIAIINSNDNPDYKLPWLFFVLLIPIVGFMLYFMFYSRKLKKKQVGRLEKIIHQSVEKDDGLELTQIKEDNPPRLFTGGNTQQAILFPHLCKHRYTLLSARRRAVCRHGRRPEKRRKVYFYGVFHNRTRLVLEYHFGDFKTEGG